MAEPTHEQLELIQNIFAQYVLEDGQFTISRDEAEAIYRELIEKKVFRCDPSS